GQINLFKAIESCSDLLTRFGGHEAAVGVTLPTRNLQEFYKRLCAYMDALPDEAFRPRIEVDAEVDLSELTIENVSKLDILAPFGQENPTPKFLAHNVLLVQGRAVGVDKNHLSCTLTNGQANLSSIMFHCETIKELLACDSVLDAVFELQIDQWRNRKTVKAVLSSLTPVEPCPAMDFYFNQEDVQFVSQLVADFDESTESFDESFSCKEKGSSCICGEDTNNCTCQDKRACWEAIANDTQALHDALVTSFIGNNALHTSQMEALSILDKGESLLTVMGTGRGKSLIFHLHAASLALQGKGTSIFIYPLRALISDQAFHLKRMLGSMGLTVSVLTGESTPRQRKEAMEALRHNEVDILLTTPEYLHYHVDDFEGVKIAFVAVDEAHHVGQSRQGYRPCYGQLDKTLAKLHSPQVLALSATVNDIIADSVRNTFTIRNTVCDDHIRDNLQIDDCRNIKKRDGYLMKIVSQGEKTIIYVNSRMESIMLVRKLRTLLPQIAPQIGFYNAGLSRLERTKVEGLFRDTTLCVLVATSAFGEGVNIPNVRHVVFYHMPFNEVEFNQMAGRAGRDNQTAYVHLLFGKQDANINQAILNESTPSHEDMGQIYRYIRSLQRTCSEQYFETTTESIALGFNQAFPSFSIASKQVECALSVFNELGLIELSQDKTLQYAEEKNLSFSEQNTPTIDLSASFKIHVVDYKGKVELINSVRYSEGVGELEDFLSFKNWVLKASSKGLEDHIRKPMLPHDYL
ncbi:MAG: DEAD/DEAH box helicase, partial [Anaerotardibacter sp.]